MPAKGSSKTVSPVPSSEPRAPTHSRSHYSKTPSGSRSGSKKPESQARSGSKSKTPAGSKNGGSKSKTASGSKNGNNGGEAAGTSGYSRGQNGYEEKSGSGYRSPKEGYGPGSGGYDAEAKHDLEAPPSRESGAQGGTEVKGGINWTLLPYGLLGFLVGFLVGVILVLFFGFCFCIFSDWKAIWDDRPKRAFLGGFAAGVLVAIVFWIALFVGLVAD